MGTSVEKAPLLCSQRLIVTILAFFGNFFVYSERVNLSVAILCMVRSGVTSSNDTSSFLRQNSSNGTIHQDENLDEQGEVDWTKPMQSQLLAMYFYGSTVLQILGGWLSSRFGCKRVWGLCHLVSAACTLLTPVSARTNFYLTCVVRLIHGLAGGVTFPAVHTLLGRWAPPQERSKLVSYTFSGPLIGWVVTSAISGVLCEYGFDNGWGSIFYLCGIFNLIWVVVWFLFAADGPDEDKRIKEREREYIRSAMGNAIGAEVAHVPWVKILTSRPVWAIIIAHMASMYVINTMLTTLPMFMKEALEFDIKQNGLLSALPTVSTFLAGLMFGYVADRVISRGRLSVKNTRKIWQSISTLGAAVMFCIAVQLDADRRYAVVVILCMATALNSADRGGFLCNHLDLAPSYSGIMFGITNTMASASGVTAPLIAGALTPNKTAEEWRNVFYVTAGICVVCNIAYILMAEGELQEWAVVKEQDDDLKYEKEHLRDYQNERESMEIEIADAATF